MGKRHAVYLTARVAGVHVMARRAGRGSFDSSGGVDSAIVKNISQLVEDTNAKSVGGLTGVIASMFAIGAKSAEETLAIELKRVKKNASAEDKKRVQEILIEHAQKQLQKKLDDKISRDIEALKKEQADKKKAHDLAMKKAKVAVDTLKTQQSIIKEQLKTAKSPSEKKKLEEALKKNQEDIINENTKINRANSDIEVSDADYAINLARLQDKQREEAEKILVQLSKDLDYNISLDDIGFESSSEDNELLQAKLESARVKNNLAYMTQDNSFDRGSFASIRPTDKTKPRTSLTSTISAPVTAVTPTQQKAQANRIENQRAEDIASQVQRDELTSEYRDLVKENLESQTKSLESIAKDTTFIVDKIKDGELNLGNDESGGGGLMDMFSNLFKKGKGLGGKLLNAGKGLGVGGGVALASLVGGAIGGVKGALDTDGIISQKGYTDPSQMEGADRLHYGLSGMLSGMSFGIIPRETIANATERIGNFITGDGFLTKAEMKAQAKDKEIQDDLDMDMMLAQRGIIQTADGSYQIKDNSIHSKILENMGVEVPNQQPQGQQLAELNEGMGGVLNAPSSSTVNNTTTNVIPESPRFRINDQATLALASQGL